MGIAELVGVIVSFPASRGYWGSLREGEGRNGNLGDTRRQPIERALVPQGESRLGVVGIANLVGEMIHPASVPRVNDSFPPLSKGYWGTLRLSSNG